MKICPYSKTRITKCYQTSMCFRSCRGERRSLRTKEARKNPKLLELALRQLLMEAPVDQKARHRGLMAAAIFLFALLIPGLALAQRPQRMGRVGRMGGGQPGVNQRARQRQNPGPFGRRDQHAHPPGFFQRLRELPPEDQERVMTNDERFRNLPPERQQQIQRNLQKWNSLSPEQKQQVRQRQEILESLSPAQRQEARALFPQYNHLPPERKQAVMKAFLHMRDLPPARRERFLSSPKVGQRFSPEERDLLRGLGQLLPPRRPPA